MLTKHKYVSNPSPYIFSVSQLSCVMYLFLENSIPGFAWFSFPLLPVWNDFACVQLEKQTPGWERGRGDARVEKDLPYRMGGLQGQTGSAQRGVSVGEHNEGIWELFILLKRKARPQMASPRAKAQAPKPRCTSWSNCSFHLSQKQPCPVWSFPVRQWATWASPSAPHPPIKDKRQPEDKNPCSPNLQKTSGLKTILFLSLIAPLPHHSSYKKKKKNIKKPTHHFVQLLRMPS